MSSQRFRPRDERAVTPHFVVLDRLGGAHDRGIPHFLIRTSSATSSASLMPVDGGAFDPFGFRKVLIPGSAG